MALQFILGGAGSGKTTYLLQRLIRESMEDPGKKYILIVPEQFTVQAARELVRMHPRRGILNIDVLSFKRLAFRVFEETGTRTGEVLTETGKNLILRLVAGREKDSLEVMRGRLDQPGYISQVKSILSEMDQYAIGDEELDQMIETAKGSPQLCCKLRDLRVLREKTAEFRRDRYITGEELLNVFAQAASGSDMLWGSVLFFDGFTGFTPVQMNALRAILPIAEHVCVSLTADPDQDMYGRILPHELFALSRKTVQAISGLCRSLHVPVEEPVLLSGEKTGRFREGSGLWFIEKNLFRTGKKTGTMASPAQDTVILSCANPMQEVISAAVRIRDLVRDGKMRYSQIALIAGSLPDYENHIRRIFDAYDIPVFIDRTIQVSANPCLSFIRGLLGIIQNDFSYESMFAFLRTGCGRIDRDTVDRMENYVLAFGIRGKRRWSEAWTAVSPRFPAEEAEVCEEARQQLMEKLGPFADAMTGQGRTVRDYSKALYEAMESFDLQKQLSDLAVSFSEKGEESRAREYSQVFAAVAKQLDELVFLLGDEKISRREYEKILEAGFSDARIGLTPPSLDEVHAGDLQRTRLGSIRVLFFLGLNDGWVPAVQGAPGFLSSIERELLEKEGFELSPGERENSYLQRFYLYLALARPSEKLFLSFCRSGSDGKGKRPSYAAGLLSRMLCLPVKDGDVRDTLQGAATLRTGTSWLAAKLCDMPETHGEEDRELQELLRQYLSEDAYRERVLRLLEACPGGSAAAARGTLSEETAADLYGKHLQGSVSRLELFAKCPFSHFAQYGLKLREREIFQVRMADMGNLMHEVFEQYAKLLKRRGIRWTDPDDDQRDRLVDECMDEAVLMYGSKLFTDTARNRFLVLKMRRIMKRAVRTVTEQIRAGSFEPAVFELPFHETGDLRAASIPLSPTEKLSLQGRIDRVDLCATEDEVFVKVVDYKSGNTTFDLNAFFFGLQLQLVIYLQAALEMEGRAENGRRAVPAGILYSPVKDPFLKAKDMSDEEKRRNGLLKALRPSGLVNGRDEIISAMDSSFAGTSLMIPVQRNKDGSIGARSKVASTQQFEGLERFAREKARQLGRGILKGRIAPAPYKRKKETACDYCRYRDVCGFDPRHPSFAYRTLHDRDAAQLWKAIMSTGEDKDDR